MVIDNFRGRYEFLSNFSRDPVVWRGKNYATSEHAFQAAKAVREEDHEYVRLAIGPATAKRLGRGVEKRPDWGEVRNDVMLDILRAKFCSGSALSDKLLSTHPHQLVEGNTWGDTYWGVCRGIGENRLGLLLMKVRDELGGDL